MRFLMRCESPLGVSRSECQSLECGIDRTEMREGTVIVSFPVNRTVQN